MATPIEPPTCRSRPRCPKATTMETTLAQVCEYVRKVVHHQPRVYVRFSGLDTRGRTVVSLRMRRAITTEKTSAQIASETYKMMRHILPHVVGWTLEVCPACIPRDKTTYAADEIRETSGSVAGTVWIRMWEDMWVLATCDGVKVYPNISYKEGYMICREWSESLAMAGVYRDLRTLVEELRNRQRPVEN